MSYLAPLTLHALLALAFDIPAPIFFLTQIAFVGRFPLAMYFFTFG